jgi:hypothetical protein
MKERGKNMFQRFFAIVMLAAGCAAPVDAAPATVIQPDQYVINGQGTFPYVGQVDVEPGEGVNFLIPQGHGIDSVMMSAYSTRAGGPVYTLDETDYSFTVTDSRGHYLATFGERETFIPLGPDAVSVYAYNRSDKPNNLIAFAAIFGAP